MQLSTRTLPLALALRRAGPLRRVRGWNRLLYLLFHPGRQSGFRFEVAFGDGMRYPGRANEFLDWSVLFHGVYELDLLGLLTRAAKRIPGCVFLDVGANVGHHSLFMAPHCTAVHAVEPNPVLWGHIEEKARHNGLRHMTLHRVALGDAEGELPFWPPMTGNTGTGSLIEGDAGNAARPITVPVRRGDNLLAAAGVGRVDVVKMDVQNFEPRALEGLRGTLERCRPLTVVEVAAANERAVADCFPDGYRFFYLRRTSAWVNRYALAPLDTKAWHNGFAVVIACPEERSALLN